ncbi:putative l-serine dehydratase protein [Oceaniovalibus guishaninsula JLT2003]|uniref:L-serine dehydratase n=1 Tax=Oceaniovalibus guishaninsula JLT2003 TaxID=1231392 RepID=K2I761_9RHOB|nr:L-serine ammonia-lyase [Oceaniovalibus guishaninsula]EKE44855.1 putative l-serine dehydratase protein [Oceaniovalibus guishaninsula JLT2003]
MFISVFEIFKHGIGPSSSHTMGPMVAADRFLSELRQAEAIPGAGAPASVQVSLHGSLAFTGKGHATDRAVMLGLLGQRPETMDPDAGDGMLAALAERRSLDLPDLPPLAFDPARDLVFDYDLALSLHANGMIFRAFDARGNPRLTQTYYSVGGGFVMSEPELLAEREAKSGAVSLHDHKVMRHYPYPFATAAEMLRMGEKSGLSIAAMKRANEEAAGADDLDAGLDALADAMNGCIDRGLAQDGILPGGLKVRRRAKAIHDKLVAERFSNRQMPHVANEWMSVYAMAVNEENAAGGRVVTAPTNGAAGTVPAVLRYWQDHCDGISDDARRDFVLTAAAIGGIIKANASISGAEVGCQGEVGSASAMAAGALCAAMGGTNAQIENAAEIALEHHLGMTCDPAGGLVQVPCIERNALGAIKAVSAAALALRGDGSHFMPLDNCIEVMRQTGHDMSTKYKETSTGGIAVNLPEC